LAVGLGFISGSLAPETLGESQFFSLIVAIALSLVLFRWLLASHSPAQPTATTSAIGVGGVLGLSLLASALLVGGQLALPSAVLADNCSNWADCREGRNLIVAIIAWLLLVALPYIGQALWTWVKGIIVPELALEPLLGPPGAAANEGALLLLRDIVADTVLRDTGDYDAYDRVKSLSNADFIAAAMRGEFQGILGQNGSYTGDGGLSISGSPGCLPAGSLVETPAGLRPVERLAAGDLVVTINANGARSPAPVLSVSRLRVLPTHLLIEIVLADGRAVRASARHPLADGRLLAEIVPGDEVDGDTVLAVRSAPYHGGQTFDLLPAGATGAYVVGGVALGSTLQAPTTVTSRGNEVSRSRRWASASKSTRSSMRTPVCPSR
jgi:hypothetical protein